MYFISKFHSISYSSTKPKIAQQQENAEEDTENYSFSSVKKSHDTTKELNFLANLIHGPKETKETFKINLFSKFDIFDDAEDTNEPVETVEKKFEELIFDCRVSQRVNVDFDITPTSSNDDQQDDLLELMDS